MTKQIDPAMTAIDRPAFDENILIPLAGLYEIIEKELAAILAQVSSFPHEYEVDRIVAHIVDSAIRH